jgi:hypothetical protein
MTSRDDAANTVIASTTLKLTEAFRFCKDNCILLARVSEEKKLSRRKITRLS